MFTTAGAERATASAKLVAARTWGAGTIAGADTGGDAADGAAAAGGALSRFCGGARHSTIRKAAARPTMIALMRKVSIDNALFNVIRILAGVMRGARRAAGGA